MKYPKSPNNKAKKAIVNIVSNILISYQSNIDTVAKDVPSRFHQFFKKNKGRACHGIKGFLKY